jgi:Heparinase II/III-like protein/Heparinase II/III N-terminus
VGAGLIGRLSSMDRHEAVWRATTVARTSLQRLEWRLQRPAWERASIAFLLRPGDLRRRVARAASENDWHHANRMLENHFVARDRRFPIHPADRDRLSAIVAQRFPDAVEKARTGGSAIVAGSYDLLGHRGLTFGTPPDWHFDPAHGCGAPHGFWADISFLDPSVGDHKVIWELNRHQHWLALGRAWWLTGERRFRRRVLNELYSWLAVNPPLTGINWASMLELALRSISWIWAIQFFADSDDGADTRPWIVDLLVALDAQLEHVRRNLSHYFSPNTHLLGEALALYVTGIALPELKHSGRWLDAGRRILLDQIDRQVLPDGGHVERSGHYHRYALDYYLLALAVARIAGDRAAESRFAEAATRMAACARSLADDRGRMPALGDDDGGSLFPIAGRDPADVTDSLDIASRLLRQPELSLGAREESFWLLDAWMPELDPPAGRPSALPRVEAFDDMGYYVARPSAGAHLVFDIGRHGFLNGGHAHADALSIVLTIDGRPLLIDPGTAVYTTNAALRDRFRGTALHNTLLVDGRPQSDPGGPFQWRSCADARPLIRVDEPGFVYFEGAHRGFAPLEHRRSVLCVEDLVLVADHVVSTSGPTKRTAIEAHWHFDPAWTEARCDELGSNWQLEAERARAWMTTTIAGSRLYRGDESSGLGWSSPRYGCIVPATTIVAGVAATPPVSIVTAFGAGLPWRVKAVAPRAAGEDGWHRAGVVLERGHDRIVVLFATESGLTAATPAEVIPHPAAPWPTRVVDTDARSAAIHLGPSGTVRWLHRVGGTRLQVAAMSLAG